MLVEVQYQQIKERALESNPLTKYINYFDRNWLQEGLSPQWYKINDVGFSLKGQMDILRDQSYSVSVRTDQTSRDLLGYCLEYLRQGVVFPFEYHIEDRALVDKKYGRKKLLDTVRPEERGGVVISSLSRMQQHLIENEGSVAVMVSPPGKTGIFMDNGREIEYQDTQIYHMQRVGDEIIGTTLRTDFGLARAKEVIEKLTGEKLSDQAGASDCVKALALQKGESKITVDELISLLEKIQPDFAYLDKDWARMRGDVVDRQKLYDFDEATRKIIAEFKSYMVIMPLTDLEKEKALAATFLRISRYFVEQNMRREYALPPTFVIRMTQGQILEEVRRLPGCAGAGNNLSSVESITNRVSSTGEGYGKECKCPGGNPDNHYHCVSCGKKYADETHNEHRTEKCSCGFKFNC